MIKHLLTLTRRIRLHMAEGDLASMEIRAPRAIAEARAEVERLRALVDGRHPGQPASTDQIRALVERRAKWEKAA